MPRRDYFLLPLIFVMTMVIILIGGEITTRLLYVQVDSVEPCEYSTASGFRYKPFCTSHTKVWDGPWITQHFNDCGYRTAESCAPRPAGSLRVDVIGSSTARGVLVNYPESFAARASAMLSSRCDSTVDFQNLGTEPTDVDTIDRRIPEALALRPAAIVMTVGPYDMIHLKDKEATRGDAIPPARFKLRDLVTLLRDSRLFLVMQAYLYRDPAFNIRAFLLNGDPADYVRTPLSAAWRQRVSDIGDLLGRITAQTTPAHVPVLLFYIPERAQAALAALPSDPAGVDPLALGAALKAVAARHGVQLFDSTRAFASGPDFESLYYLTDGHPREGGHAALAGVVEKALLSEPAFNRCKQPGPSGVPSR
ncbi:SGNH/GDSL hydrolase family protein [Rhodopila sp.]|uniref:SGNH/GDSL hydrolase family protein n=1 Tax=Rhodopila sp. TaxID=2480087 RepID=UPI003D0CC69E